MRGEDLVNQVWLMGGEGLVGQVQKEVIGQLSMVGLLILLEKDAMTSLVGQ